MCSDRSSRDLYVLVYEIVQCGVASLLVWLRNRVLQMGEFCDRNSHQLLLVLVICLGLSSFMVAATLELPLLPAVGHGSRSSRMSASTLKQPTQCRWSKIGCLKTSFQGSLTPRSVVGARLPEQQPRTLHRVVREYKPTTQAPPNCEPGSKFWHNAGRRALLRGNLASCDQTH